MHTPHTGVQCYLSFGEFDSFIEEIVLLALAESEEKLGVLRGVTCVGPE